MNKPLVNTGQKSVQGVPQRFYEWAKAIHTENHGVVARLSSTSKHIINSVLNNTAGYRLTGGHLEDIAPGLGLRNIDPFLEEYLEENAC